MRRVTIIGGVLILAVLAGSVALAQTGGPYHLTWHTVDNGGGRLAGGSYVLLGTAGQPDVGAISGGGYRLAGGFWPGSPYLLYLPLTMKNY